MKQLNEFLWLDDDKNLHFDIPALLRVMNVEDTPANRDECLCLVREVAEEQFPDARIIETE